MMSKSMEFDSVVVVVISQNLLSGRSLVSPPSPNPLVLNIFGETLKLFNINENGGEPRLNSPLKPRLHVRTPLLSNLEHFLCCRSNPTRPYPTKTLPRLHFPLLRLRLRLGRMVLNLDVPANNIYSCRPCCLHLPCAGDTGSGYVSAVTDVGGEQG
jgi:hypothetical protein